MRYKSTCGTVSDVSFETALLQGGYTSAGGVFVPETVPVDALNSDQLMELKDASFVTIAEYIASQFISTDEVPASDLKYLVEEGLKPEKFHPDYIPVVDMGVELDMESDEKKCRLFRAEAYHSPSLVFKDYRRKFNLQIVGQYMNYFTKKKYHREKDVKQKKSNVLICTTGDTGSAAIEALKGLPFVNVFVGFPCGSQITPFQRLQMTTCPDDNVHCFQVQGSCDDLDLVYLDLFADKTLTDEFNLTSANSTNWVRIMGQVAIFTHIYLRVIHQCQPQKNVGDRVKIVIPSGACGNVCSALFAVRMGLPLDIVVANNSNAFFRTIYHTGVIVVESGNQRQTVSNAMDSQWSPALTRILFLLSPRDNTGLYDQHALQKLKRAEPINVPCKALASLREQVCGCEVASDEETIAMMKHLNQNQYASKHQNTRSNSSDRNHDSSINNKGLVVCPHTAVGFVALKKHLQGPAETGADKKHTLDFNLVQNTECANMLEDIDPVVVLATAHPDKFSHVIKDRAGLEYNVTHSFPSAEERFVKLDKDEDWRKRIVEMIKSAN